MVWHEGNMMKLAGCPLMEVQDHHYTPGFKQGEAKHVENDCSHSFIHINF